MKIRISLAFALALSSNIALAATPTNKEELSNTTLTELYNQGLSDIKSAYQLEEVTAENSDFSITKFWNDNGTLKAVDFNVVFNDMIGSGDIGAYFKWQVVDGNLTLVAGTADEHDIKAGAEGVISERQEVSSTLSFTSSFVGSGSTTPGGAIDNFGLITGITGHFIGNYSSNLYSACAGAIYNDSTIGNITGDFIVNYVVSAEGSSMGGAIYNTDNGTIGDITGDFIKNYVSSIEVSAQGGAIYNLDGTIGDITGDFVGNYASGPQSADGGAIYNTHKIGDIIGDFIENYASSTGEIAQGGAIHNWVGSIDSITGSFIGNYASGSDVSACGGAIYNCSTIGDITGDFIENYTSSSGFGGGGAIYNEGGTIGNITGNFVRNDAVGSNGYADGGAIYNTANGTIGDITGDFIENYTSSSGYGSGGAISNIEATIGDIKGDFIKNYAVSAEGDRSCAAGGAIYNQDGTIGNITGNFIGNYTSASSIDGYAEGGAIANSSTIGDITGNFVGNYASSLDDSYGGAISNWDGTIGDITGDFIGNYASASADDDWAARGGAIYNREATMSIREGSRFTGNYVSTDGGVTKNFEAIYNYSDFDDSPAMINFNAYDSTKSIIVNDGINGVDCKAKCGIIVFIG